MSTFWNLDIRTDPKLLPIEKTTIEEKKAAIAQIISMIRIAVANKPPLDVYLAINKLSEAEHHLLRALEESVSRTA